MNEAIHRLLQILSKRGISQRKLALEIGCTPSLISDWKSGKVSSFPKYLVQISEYLDVSADYLLCRTPFENGEDWKPLIEQYQLAEDNVQSLVRRLLGLTEVPGGMVSALNLTSQEDMRAVMELIAMFESLSIVGKSRVIATAANELDKIQEK
jgi:transcriptional regulator with XRE-family HTH domain